MPLLRKLKLSAWIVVLIFSTGYITFSLAANHWDPFSFILVGGRYDPRLNNTYVGYDGQFAYQIARDPINGWKYVDVPAYRYQRILYPLLARVLAFGNESSLPWTLIIINLASIVIGTWIFQKLLNSHGQSSWYALSYGLFAGLLVSLRLDLTEPLAFLFVLGGLWAFEGRKWFLSAGLFVCAALSREVTLAFAVACCLSLLTNRQFRLGIVWGAGIALPFIIWQGLLWHWFGTFGIRAGGAMSDPLELIPLHGWWGYAAVNAPDFWVKSLLIVPAVLLPTIIALWAAGKALWQGARGQAAWGLLLNSGLILFLPTTVILDPLGVLRTLVGLVISVMYFGLIKPSRRALNYALLWLALLIFIFLDSFISVFY